MIRLITGPPGCGKTTSYVNSLSSEFFGKTIWVAEPFQSIVRDKSAKNSSVFIEFVNWADAFREGGIEEFRDGDILVVDEPQILWTSEYRGFHYDTPAKIYEKYKNVVFISATYKRILSELYGLENNVAVHRVEKRLERKAIRIRIWDGYVKSFLTEENIGDYSIININNAKQLYSIAKYFNENDISDSVLVRSSHRELNNFIFSQGYTDEVWNPGASYKEVFIGTVALGQGVDKDIVGIRGDRVERILFDANSYKLEDVPKISLYEYIAENIIQGDRYRYDTDIEIDVIYKRDERTDERLGWLQMEIESYVKEVYGEGTEVEVALMGGFDNGGGIIKNYTYDNFRGCLQSYDPEHRLNKKDLRERFEEILEGLIDDSEDIYKRKNGSLKTVALIAGDLFNRFSKEDGFLQDREERYYRVVKSIPQFLKYLGSTNLANLYKGPALEKKARDSFVFKLPEDKRGEKMGELEREVLRDLANFSEAIFIMTIKLLGYRLNFAEELSGRGGNDIQLCPRSLRGFLISKDYDIKGCHLAALIRGLDPGLDIKTLLEEGDIYSIPEGMGIDEFIKVLLGVRKYSGFSIEDIRVALPKDRDIVKNVLLFSINSLNIEERRLLVEKFLSLKYGIIIDKDKWKRVEGKAAALFNMGPKERKKLGYYNGIAYEREWLGHLNSIDDVFRISDGFCVILNGDVADELRTNIEDEHRILMSEERVDHIGGIDYRIYKEFYDGVDTWNISNEEMIRTFIDDIQKVLISLSLFAKDLSRGRYKGKNRGKAIIDKTYICIKDRIINGKEYLKDNEYSFGKDFIKTVGRYNRRYFIKK